MTKPLRTVVVGYGKIADVLGNDERMRRYFPWISHAQVLSDHPAFDWRAVVDPSEEALERARRRGVPHLARDVTGLPPGFEADVAVMTAPPAARTRAVEALPGLRAVLVEKPLGVREGEAEAFLDLCARRRVLVQVNLWRRGVDGYRALGEGGLRSLIGAPQAAFALYGNGLWNNASHLVDFVRLLLGEVVAVQAAGAAGTLPEAPIPGDVQLPFTLALADGLRVMVQPLEFRHYREIALDVWGERGRLAFMQEGFLTLSYPLAPNRTLDGAVEVASDRAQPLDIPIGRAFRSLYDNLVAALDGSAALVSPGAEALATEKVLGAVLESAGAGGAWVALEARGRRGAGGGPWAAA